MFHFYQSLLFRISDELRAVSSLGLFVLGALLSIPAPVLAEPTVELLRPDNTGIPGELIEAAAFSPAGELWVGARWPFWQAGGVGIYDRDTDRWSGMHTISGDLPTEEINEIVFEDSGVAWLATHEGLIRIDGDDTQIFNTQNAPFVNNNVRSIAIAPNGDVWICNVAPSSGAGKILRYSNGTWTAFGLPEIPFPQPWNTFNDVFVDSDGIVWVCNDTANGLARYDGTSWTLVGANVWRFKEIEQDSDGNLWLTTTQLGYRFYKFDRQNSWSMYDANNTPLGQTTILTVTPDDSGNIYVGNWMGQIIRSSDAGQSWTMVASGFNTIYDLLFDPLTDEIWVHTIGAMGRLDANHNWIRDYNSYNTGMPWYFIEYQINRDRFGRMWVNAGETGASLFEDGRWRNWGNHNAQAEIWPFPSGNEPNGTVYVLEDGTIFLGGNGVARLNPEGTETTGFWNWQNNPGMGTSIFTGFAEDAAGTLFGVTEDGGVFRFGEAQWETEPVSDWQPSDDTTIARDSQGNVYVRNRFALRKWDGSQWQTLDEPSPNFLGNTGGTRDLAVGPDDTLWVTTFESLLHIDGDNWTVYDASNSPMPVGAARSVAFRDDGVMGLVMSDFDSQSGAASIIDGPFTDPASWSTVLPGSTLGESLPHWQLDECEFDAAGDLWVSCMSEAIAILDAPPVASACPADVTGDDTIDLADLNAVLASFGTITDSGDTNADGVVDLADLNTVLAAFGQNCE